ncbi:hypothetical protein B296_00047460 [Ensete ventricosum]|uniref:Uncharacterized protein n=1 Tax=Ensete ventricosum TaxID=4639 RepID=A0A426YZD1_ENSVE|nr:hypothetical protein B296_00047460 [Ensete ventricosum]
MCTVPLVFHRVGAFGVRAQSTLLGDFLRSKGVRGGGNRFLVRRLWNLFRYGLAGGRPSALMSGFEDSLGDEHGPPNKRSRHVKPPDQQVDISLGFAVLFLDSLLFDANPVSPFDLYLLDRVERAIRAFDTALLQAFYYNAHMEAGPFGLHLTKSPSVVDVVQKILPPSDAVSCFTSFGCWERGSRHGLNP